MGMKLKRMWNRFKIIDLYILRKFLGTFFFAMGLIILIVVIFDFSEKIDKFIDKNAPFNEIIFVYYLNFITYFVNLFSPLCTFIAVILFTSRMAFNTEIVAILSSGISFRRLLVPYLVGATLLAMLSIYLSNFLIPPANQRRLDFENTYVRNPQRFRERDIHMQIRPGVFVYMESFNDRSQIGYRFSIEQMEEGRLSYKLMAETAGFDSLTGKWRIDQYNERFIDNRHEQLRFGDRRDTLLPFTPADFIHNLREMETLNYRELKEFIENERLKGSENLKFYEVEKYRRIAFPFSTLVLTFIGVALSSRKVRGGIGLHLGAGIALRFSFILFMQISTTLATNGNLHPMLSVWIPNIIYGLLGVVLLRMAPK